MVSVDWADIVLAERNGVRTIATHRVSILGDMGTYRIESIPDTALGYRANQPAMVRVDEVGTPAYQFTDNVATESWRAYNRAEKHLLSHAIKHNAAVKRHPEKYRLVLRTRTVPDKSADGTHPDIDISGDVGIVKETQTYKGWTFVVQDGAGELHILAFSQRGDDSTYALQQSKTPYSLASERVLQFSFEAVRAAQHRLLEKGVQLARNTIISFGEQAQIRVADEELANAEDWVDHTKLPTK